MQSMFKRLSNRRARRKPSDRRFRLEPEPMPRMRWY
jgi:hypothetical protein